MKVVKSHNYFKLSTFMITFNRIIHVHDHFELSKCGLHGGFTQISFFDNKILAQSRRRDKRCGLSSFITFGIKIVKFNVHGYLFLNLPLNIHGYEVRRGGIVHRWRDIRTMNIIIQMMNINRLIDNNIHIHQNLDCQTCPKRL